MGKKDYKKGMADAMEAYQSFGEKQEAATRHVGQEVEKTAQKVDKLGGKIGEITDYITDKEKAVLYKLNTPVDIADLDDAEKRILMAVLYQLSADEDEVTEEQQNYVRAVQQYLKIYNPQTEIDLSAVENIEDISAQKAVLQCALEFFRLGTNPEELTDKQEDFLDYFQVNRRTRREIDGFIDAIVEAVGIKGLSEKYGFVAEQPRSEFAKYQDNGRIPEMVADACIAQFFGKAREFYDGRRFLETKDYIVFQKDPRYIDDSAEEDDETEDSDNHTGTELFRVSKRDGKTERIQLDYKKTAGWPAYQADLGYCIWKNTIYFTNRWSDRDVKIWIVDVSEQTIQVISIPHTFQDTAHINISANETYIMLAVLEANDEYDDMEPVKVYVVDLTQNNRTFVLNPGLSKVYDAFLLDEKFLFWGVRGKQSDLDSFFKYDPKQKTLESILPEVHKKSFRGLRNEFLYYPVLSDLVTIDKMWRTGDTYYFLRSWIHDSDCKMNCGWFRIKDKKLEYRWSDDDDFRVIAFLPNGILYTTEYKDEMTLNLMGSDLSEGSYPGEDFACTEDFSEYVLLGDYLYRHCYGEGWQKTNISNGWDNLQWEVFQMPD